MAKPDPNDPDNKAYGGDTDEGQCLSCGGSCKDPGDPSQDCRACGGSGKR